MHVLRGKRMMYTTQYKGKSRSEGRQLLRPCLLTYQPCAMPIRQELSWFPNAIRVISGVSPKPTLSIHWKLSLHDPSMHGHCWWELLTKFRYLPKPFQNLAKVRVPTSKPPKIIWCVNFIVLSLLAAWVYGLCVLFLSMANLINSSRWRLCWMIIALESYPLPRACVFFLVAFTPLNQRMTGRETGTPLQMGWEIFQRKTPWTVTCAYEAQEGNDYFLNGVWFLCKNKNQHLV